MHRFLRCSLAAAALLGPFPLLVSSASAFKVPKHVYPMERIGEAQKEAFDEKDALLIVYANPAKPPT